MSCSGPGSKLAEGMPHDPVFDRSKPLSKSKLMYSYPLVNCPGKTVVGLKIMFAPGAAAPPHRHGGCTVTGYVTQGRVYNKMNDSPVMEVETGGSWHEAPGCHHRMSANASETEPAEILAMFIVDTKALEEEGPLALVVIDEEYQDLAALMQG
ncbi:cupin domain protein [Pterulicium gracile]|uniref:Cupin domain protein n=1 Tax=Pterulicium gracile TaxID=1884261 RepID=A0A5C3QWM3_9AGAR|nr:cupin domain protein [Pterula gracilis]